MTNDKNSRFRWAAAVGLLFALIPESGIAQSALDNWQKVMSLAPGSGVSIKTKAGKKYHGDLVIVTAESLTLYSDEPAFPGRMKRLRELRRDAVQEVRALAPTASVMAGGAIGGGVGAGIGAIVDVSARSNEDRGVATATLALLGSSIGVAIGRSSPFIKGKKIYVAP